MAKNKTQSERRLNKRSKAQELELSIEGNSYATTNLSIGGSMVEGYDGALSAGALLSVKGIGSSGGKLTKVDIRARVNRANPEARQLALTFLELDTGAYEILQNFMAIRIQGLKPPKKPEPDSD
ncbi:MAG: PilZ domain-containing protein [Proteobacteria bacterium]|nr:PilZ domain-containing protein [Pseudomonadota bacterium]